MIRPYPSIFNLGHKAVADIFKEPVLVQEKVDGSQISFKKEWNPETLSHVLKVRSKGAQLVIEAPDKMFARGVDEIKSVEPLLIAGWTYRGEYLAKPKHNTLAYDRVPSKNIVIFDIDRGEEDYADPPMVKIEAERLGFEVVPSFTETITSALDLRALLDQASFLGGQKVEGLVVKNYQRFDPKTKHVLMAKFVSEAFKESHGMEWKATNPSKADVVAMLISSLKTSARWSKAVQHLRESGQLEDSPRDIALLFKEVPLDVKQECGDLIKDKLFEWAWPQIQRGITAGLAEWYKERLLEKQFDIEAPSL